MHVGPPPKKRKQKACMQASKKHPSGSMLARDESPDKDDYVSDGFMDLVDMGNGYYETVSQITKTNNITNTLTTVRLLVVAASGNVAQGNPMQSCSCTSICNCSFNSCDWLLDSGASMHITLFANNFIHLKSTEPQPITVASGRSNLQIIGVGTVLIQHVFEHKGIHRTELIRLEDVCHIPGMVHHILSLNKLLEEGMHIYGNNAAISLFTKGNDKPLCRRYLTTQVMYSDGSHLQPSIWRNVTQSVKFLELKVQRAWIVWWRTCP